jgi:hypothetical protein
MYGKKYRSKMHVVHAAGMFLMLAKHSVNEHVCLGALKSGALFSALLNLSFDGYQIYKSYCHECRMTNMPATGLNSPFDLIC